ncbi:MAG: UDP-N-acetylmuramoyl-L-alanyl-D-glutamate--2,6-diaminopimelate ligase [Gammaproteobacteria bacterium]|nr:UDP-N-acetylmuramoyl-L-alanyl-D-glutamate--2,6-diaminopimelate ligase [Gammaproteobacteria bacterium]
MMPASNSNNTVSLKQLLQGVAKVSDKDNRPVTGLSLNSKTLKQGEVFCALAGRKEHGLNYAAQAIQRGACAVLWEADTLDYDVVMLDSLSKHAPLIPVVNFKHQLGFIAERFYGEPSKQLYMVGVTGTNGKTSCSQFLARALNADEASCVIGTLGNGFVDRLQEATHTTPDAITLHRLLAEFRDQQAKNVVMEVSSHGLEQGRVSGVSFDMAIFTNLSRDHLDYHGDMAAYGNAKKLLFELPGLKTAVINVDDDFGLQLADSLKGKLEVVRYGVAHQNTGIDVRASKVRLDNAGIHFDVISRWSSGIVSSPLLGQFNVSNLLAVLSALLSKGMRFEEALRRISRLTNVHGRMERVANPRGNTLFVVDYAHTPDALAKALQSLRKHVDTKKHGQLWCVFGCGGDRDQGKRPVMGAAAEQFADHVIITDDNPRTEAASHIVAQILAGVSRQQDVTVIHDRVAAIRHAITHAGEHDVVLVAGKGHEAYQIFGEEKRPYAGDAAITAGLLEQLQDSSGE